MVLGMLEIIFWTGSLVYASVNCRIRPTWKIESAHQIVWISPEQVYHTFRYRRTLGRSLVRNHSLIVEVRCASIFHIAAKVDHLKVIVGANSQIVDSLSQELAGRRITVKIFDEELKPAAE